MATLIKTIDNETWKKEIPVEKIKVIYPCDDEKLKVWYIIDKYNNTNYIVCDSIKF